ncbi:hypothetical protein CBS147323_6070 [Aspergillus niger]|uniref:putative ABC efflux transporter n=1 Tax=Aspergillus lacticoffeatus (strain CBS 101883) TaxID=1450533 RepID=UPI000D7F92D3|nr:uncharacterized protein BO96DRAFT_334631 [Aspergillus niger CBS 101883]KAI2964962.1 hypothetical protein CBS147323_6070 [Aspergillus niger]KAI3024126.1 hypothetical protein CBS147347_6349 [Aspergillus niger]KAI3084402.1 hypothetical protein CBS147353_1953 [Aspergillus niger]PYH57841.1 hypothetical protein BO96DRAFT_334631 [Aspergillus niger CBS 101883]GJP88878.1 uncharacterized protein AlacWU_01777 [Aspergillus niger]
MVVCIRDIQSLIGIGCTIAVLAAILGWVFWHLDGSLAGIRSRQGSLWDATGLYGYLMLISEICRLLGDVKYFDHERREQLVGPVIFILSRRAVKLILEDLSLPTLFTLIYYPMVGYRDSKSQVFFFWLMMFLTHINAVGFATVSVATTRNFYGAIFIGNMYFTLQTAASGYFLQANQIPLYVQWLKWLTTTFYTFSALCTLEYVGYNGSNPGYLYDCPYSHDVRDPQCKEYTGAFIMDSLWLPSGGIWKHVLVLCAFAIFYQGSAIAIFRVKTAGRLCWETRHIFEVIVGVPGIYYIEGSPISSQKLRGLVSYVPQDDYNLLPTLTVRETLYFATELRCSGSVPSHERKRRVEDMVKRFGLESCANTIVGSTSNKEINGGEKRRLSIACEVVTEPRVLVLDEPTSGLDSRTALSVLELLHQLSSDGCTVILSIHQPSSAMWALISACLLLSPDGRPVYAADASQMASYFDCLGYTCPHTASLADFVIDITAGSSSRELESLIDKWTHWQSSEMSTASETPTLWHLDPSGPQTKCRRFIPTTRVLLHRAYLNMLRSPLSLFVRLSQCPGMGLIWTIFVAPLHKDYNSIQTRMGLMIQYGPVAFIGMLQNIATFPAERDLFELESSMHLYGATAFLTQYTAIELPLEIIAAGIFSILFAYAAQLGPTATELGVCFLTAVCTLNTGESLSNARVSRFWTEPQPGCELHVGVVVYIYYAWGDDESESTAHFAVV